MSDIVENVESDTLESVLNKSIKGFKEDLDKINNAVDVTAEISLAVLSKGRSIIANANSTKSIDERINVLVAGLNDVIEYSAKRASDLKRKVEDLELQIDTLEKQFESIEEKEEEKKT